MVLVRRNETVILPYLSIFRGEDIFFPLDLSFLNHHSLINSLVKYKASISFE